MDESISKALREARGQRGLSLSDAEQATKIRVKYLRALETGDVDEVLPGAYVRGFLRSYAEYLGLDADPLVERLERDLQGGGQAAPAPVRPAPPRPLGAPKQTGPGWKVLAASVATIVVLLAVVGVVAGGDDDDAGSAGPGQEAAAEREAERAERAERRRAERRRAERRRERQQARGAEVRVRIAPTAPVWVCLETGGGERLIDGEMLEPNGDGAGPFEARRLRLTIGNAEARVVVDGSPLELEPSPVPLGYELTPDGVEELDEADRPTCA